MAIDPKEYENVPEFPALGTQTYAGLTPYATYLRHGVDLKTRAEMAAEHNPYTGPRVAERAPLSLLAEKLAEEELARYQHGNRFNRATSDIDTARTINPSQVMQPYLTHVTGGPDQYIDRYLEKFTPYLQGLRKDAREEFERYTFPNIAAHFASIGAYNSGARQSAQNRARQEFEKNQMRQQEKMALDAYNAGHEHYNKNAATQLEGANLTGRTAQHAREMGLAVGREELNTENQQSAQARLHQLALGEHGYRGEEHKQRILNEQRKAHQDKMEHVKNNLAFEGNLLAGHPVVAMSTFTAAPAPPPTNYSHAMAASLQQMPGINAMQQPRKAGGRVGHYADGGQVAPPQYADHQLPAFNTPEMQQVRQTAGELYNTHPHNAAISMGIAGAKMGERLGGPMGAYSAGNKAAFENYQNVEQSRYLNKERGANLMQKIQDSRLDQHKVLHEYANKQREFGETKRLHDAQIAHFAAQNEALRLKAPPKPHIVDGQHISIDPETGKPVATPVEGFNRKKSVDEMRSRREAIATLGEATGTKHGVEEARKYNKQLSTGPVRGFIDKWLGENLAAASGMGTVKDIEGFKRSVGNIFLHAHQGLKNIPRSEQFAKRIDDIKGSVRQESEANEETFNEIYKTADLSEKVAMDTLMDMGMTKEEIMGKIKEFSSVLQEKETPGKPDDAAKKRYEMLLAKGAP